MNLRYLLGYSYFPYEFDIKEWAESWLIRLRAAGFDVQGTCLAIDPPSQCLLFDEIDRRWKEKEPKLMKMYENLAYELENYDVFINCNGINLHPEFVKSLPTFNVYGCFDDPESSEVLSKPVAAAYDLCMVANVAEVETYKTWGVKNAVFWPAGFRDNDYDHSLTENKIITAERDITVSLTCERQTPHRRERLDKFALAHPHGTYYGKGWPNGFLPEADRVGLLQRTKIGINIHNSTGPINYRTYYLPANGVLQICDNKSHLGKIFELGKEVLGYDSIEEAIDLTRYYLDHDQERKQIAVAGFKRAHKDYNEIEVFRVLVNSVEPLYQQRLNEEEKKRDKTIRIGDTELLPPEIDPERQSQNAKVFVQVDSLYSPDQWCNRFIKFLNQVGIDFELVDLVHQDYFKFLKKVNKSDCLIGRFGHAEDDLKKVRPIFGQLHNVFQGRVFPAFDTYYFYDNKIKQIEFLKSKGYPTPAAAWIRSEKELKQFMRREKLGFPLVMKKAEGAGSTNVSLANSVEDCQFPSIYQEFCEGNDRDLRIDILGHRAMGFERMNRDDDFRASGSGKIVYPEDLDFGAINIATKISLENNFECMAYDLVKLRGEWVVVELSYAFMDTAVLNCPYYYDLRTGEKVNKMGIYPQDFILQDFLKKFYGLTVNFTGATAPEPAQAAA